MLRILALTALLLTSAAPTALACTCDPHPAIELVKCVLNGDGCPPAIEDLRLPPAKDVVEAADPRNWPCTCDPQPSPL